MILYAINRPIIDITQKGDGYRLNIIHELSSNTNYSNQQDVTDVCSSHARHSRAPKQLPRACSIRRGKKIRPVFHTNPSITVKTQLK
jgi:hypothetical protein